MKPSPLPLIAPGAAVRAARHRVGLTQAALAAELGVTQSAVCMWETGKNRVSVDTLVHVSHVTGVPVADLMAHPAP